MIPNYSNIYHNCKYVIDTERNNFSVQLPILFILVNATAETSLSIAGSIAGKCQSSYQCGKIFCFIFRKVGLNDFTESLQIIV